MWVSDETPAELAGIKDKNGVTVQNYAVYRARVKGKPGWSLVQCIYDFAGFWVEDIGYAVQPSDIEIFSERILPPWPRSAARVANPSPVIEFTGGDPRTLPPAAGADGPGEQKTENDSQ